MKTLVTCNPREFLVQTNKIRKTATELLKGSGIFDIRKVSKELEGKPEEEMQEIARNTILNNLNNSLDVLLERDVDKTVELLCLCFFVEPKDSENVKMAEMLNGIVEMISDDAVMSFFISALKIVPKDILNTLQK